MGLDIFSPIIVAANQLEALRKQAKLINEQRTKQYEQACKDWIETNVHNRDIGIAITPLPYIPKIVVVTDDGVWTEEVNTAADIPTLPAYVPPKVGNPLELINPTLMSPEGKKLLKAMETVYLLLLEVKGLLITR